MSSSWYNVKILRSTYRTFPWQIPVFSSLMAVCGTGDIGSCAAIVVERTTTASSPWVAAGIAGACRVSDALRNSSGCSPNYSTNHCIHAAIVHCGPQLQCVLSLHFPVLHCIRCKGFKRFPSFVDIYQYRLHAKWPQVVSTRARAYVLPTYGMI